MMASLSEHDVFIFVAQLGVIILAARIFGLLARRFGQPIIVGEVIAGIILGPSIFGAVFPGWREALFPTTGIHQHLLIGISWLCVLFLLLTTGLEIDFSASLRHGKRILLTTILGLGLPFFAVFSVASVLSFDFYSPGTNPLHGNLLLATSLSVVAIPVVAKILFDLKILRSFVGLNIITSGVLSDVLGWAILMVIISFINEGTITFLNVLKPLAIMGGYLTLTLTAGRWIVDKFFGWVNVQTKEPTAFLGLLFALALLNGAISHLLGLHVILGAFIAGLMAGESKEITPYIRESLQNFIFGVFAPIFFVLIGMQLNFSAGVNWTFILLFFGLASIFKIGGGFLGALLGGIGRKNALAVGCGLNTQGTMGIIVALIGMDLGVFTNELFSMIVIICVLTAVLVGPLLKWTIKGVQRPLAKYLDREHVFLNMPGETKKEIIENMTKVMSVRGIIDNPETVRKAIWMREESMSTAIGEGIAIPHARIHNLAKPILCFFRLKDPVEFSSPDNKPVQLLFLELTDNNDDGMQLNLITQVTRFLASADNRKKLLTCAKEDEIHQLLSLDERV